MPWNMNQITFKGTLKDDKFMPKFAKHALNKGLPFRAKGRIIIINSSININELKIY